MRRQMSLAESCGAEGRNDPGARGENMELLATSRTVAEFGKVP